MRSCVSLTCFVIAACLGCLMAAPVSAQEAASEANRIVRPMTVIDPVTLQADTTSITLWGIKPLSSSSIVFQMKAMDLLDTLTGTEAVNCKIVGGTPPEVTASCTGYTSSDLGLELLNHGYAMVDRRQLQGSAFALTYAQAQETARLNQKGIWRLVAEEDRGSRMPAWLQPYLPLLVPLALVLGPLSGLLITVFMMRFWLRKMSALQKEEFERSNRKESILTSRERYVLISALEGELTENRNKIEAFLLIYGDMLRSLKDTTQAPKYQRVGDIVQKRPFMSKTVFEANVGKLSLLDMRLAGQLSKFYTSLPTGNEYINIDPTMPLENAVEVVEGALKEAEKILPGLDQVIQALAAAATKQADTAHH